MASTKKLLSGNGSPVTLVGALVAGFAVAMIACAEAEPADAPLASDPPTTVVADPPAKPKAPSSSVDAGTLVAPPPASSLDWVVSPVLPPTFPPAGDAAPPGPTSICAYESGEAIPYDHTRGVVEEYSFELAMSCDLGGYVQPLMDADPINLSEIGRFNSALTDWFRERVLGCPGNSSNAPTSAFLLVPLSQADGLSRGDVNAVVPLFMSIFDRHDGQPDGIGAALKASITARLKVFGTSATQRNTDELTKRSQAPECAIADAGTD